MQEARSASESGKAELSAKLETEEKALSEIKKIVSDVNNDITVRDGKLAELKKQQEELEKE